MHGAKIAPCDPVLKTGLAIFVFAAGMNTKPHEAYYSAKGDMFIVMQYGVLDIQTELGKILVPSHPLFDDVSNVKVRYSS